MSYSQFCPIAKAAEVIGEKWSLVILRELAVGSDTFNTLRNYIPLISPALLSKRLVEFEDSGIVEKIETGVAKPKYRYELTKAGKELTPILVQIGEWGNKWAVSKLKKQDYDPRLLLWDIKRNIKTDVFQNHDRYVIEFWCTGVPRPLSRFWFVIEKGRIPDVCHTDPGHEVNLSVRSDIKTYVNTWMGWDPLEKAIKNKQITFEGMKKDVQMFPKWYSLNPFAKSENFKDI